MTQRIDPHLWQRHAWMNRLQTAVLVVVLATLLATVGWLLWGNDGILYMLVFCAVSLVLQPLAGRPANVPTAAMATLRIDAGRGDKLRPGDIVGALTGEAGLHKDAIGRIDVFATRSYVAIARAQANHALAQLRAGKIKGRKFRVNRL